MSFLNRQTEITDLSGTTPHTIIPLLDISHMGHKCVLLRGKKLGLFLYTMIHLLLLLVIWMCVSVGAYKRS